MTKVIKNREAAFVAVLCVIEEQYRQGRLTKKEYKKACKKLRKHFAK